MNTLIQALLIGLIAAYGVLDYQLGTLYTFRPIVLGPLVGLVLGDLEFFCEGKCALVQVPRSVLEKTGTTDSDLEGIAALPRQIEGVLLGVTVKEKADGTVKASVRANPPANAAAVCEKFGGGGHTGAAGCSFPGLSLAEAAEKLKAACEEELLVVSN